MRMKNNIVIKSIFINLIYLFLMLLLFEPFWSATDFNEIEKIYGLFTGELSYQTKFVQFNYSKIVIKFIENCSFIPWYTVLYYCLMFLTLVIIVYFILRWQNDRTTNIIAHLLVLFYSYEGYVHINFTKVAGFCGAAAIILILNRNKNVWSKIAGILFAIFTFLIRYSMGVSVLGVLALAVVFCACLDVFLGKIDKKIYIGYFLSFLMIFAFMEALPFIKYEDSTEHAYWNTVLEWNSYRSSVQDYNIPEYSDNLEFYQEYGISQNTLDIWYMWNDDMYKLNAEVGKAMLDRQAHTAPLLYRIFSFENIDSFFKQVPLAILTIDVFFVFISIGVIYVLGSRNKETVIKCSLIAVGEIICILGVNYYLFIGGRFLQHRVDVSILLSFFSVLIMLMDQLSVKIELNDTYYELVVMCVCCLLLAVPYEYYGDDISYISNEQISKNKAFYEYTSSDLSKCYLIGNDRETRAKNEMCYKPFELPQTGIKYNIIAGACPENEMVRKNNNIENPYIDIVDNDSMFLVLDESSRNMDKWCEYISDSYGDVVSLFFVENKYGRNIFSVVSLNEAM